MARTKNDDPLIGDKGDNEPASLDKVRDFLMKAREHKGTIDKMEPNYNVFAGCTFPAHCRDLKWNRNGTLVIPLEVAYRYISLAEPMIYSSGVPLAIHVERYSPTRIMQREAQANGGD
jgi:hypothetical protein